MRAPDDFDMNRAIWHFDDGSATEVFGSFNKTIVREYVWNDDETAYLVAETTAPSTLSIREAADWGLIKIANDEQTTFFLTDSLPEIENYEHHS